MNVFEPVAIVGVGGLFPGSSDLETFWQQILTGRDQARNPPLGRWSLPIDQVMDTRTAAKDKIYSSHACFLDPFEVQFDGLSIDRQLVSQLDVKHQIALEICRRAFYDARVQNFDKSRTGIILGSIALPTDKISKWAEECLQGGSTAGSHPLNRQVTGLPAMLAARALNLGLGGFTLDAACASSLYAIKLACDQLQNGSADAMIAGGLSRPDSLYTQMGFAQLRALSKSGRCSPFDYKSDGLIVGEGGGAFLLKLLRNVDPRDHVYGVIRGVSLSNDISGNLLAPASEGQLRAMRPAYEMARWSPNSVDLIECHATGTPVGDAVEFESLCELWKGQEFQPGQAVIGSVKSNVGHLLTGANSAGLMKALLALHSAKLPPTANFEKSNPNLKSGSPFQVLTEARNWNEPAAGHPRRAAISGFGFGGVNAHLLVEEYRPDKKLVSVDQVPPTKREPIAIVGLAAQIGETDCMRRIARHLLGFESIPSTIKEKHAGYWLEKIDFPVDRFRIPPTELQETLPQQIVLLLTADAALKNYSKSEAFKRIPDPRFGTFIGVNLDLNTTNFHLRWQALSLGHPNPDSISPDLTANRTMGALASIAASRVARAFEFGGPCFTLSEEANSGGRALQLAVEALLRGEIDRALVGSVDLPGDFRALAAIGTSSPIVSGSVAFVLKRLSDAHRDGDTIYATIDEIGISQATSLQSNLRLDYNLGIPKNRDDLSQAVSNKQSLHPKSDEGVNTTLFGVLTGVLSLYYKLLPATFSPSEQPTYWLHDTCDGIRELNVYTGGEQLATSKIVLREAATGKGTLDELKEYPIVLAADRLEELTKSIHSLQAKLFALPSLAEVFKEQISLLNTHTSSLFRLALCASSVEELKSQLEFIQRAFSNDSVPNSPQAAALYKDNVFFNSDPIGFQGKVAFVYPGSGNQFDGMGADFGTLFPEILHQQHLENRTLRHQFAADAVWQGHCNQASERDLIFAQVSLGALNTSVIESLGIKPEIVLGYSLGESASLFSTRVWTDRDEMFERMRVSTLFTSDLAPPYNSARRFWNIPLEQEFVWETWVVNLPHDKVRQAILPDERVYICIINTPEQSVIGGVASDVAKLLHRLKVTALPVTGVTTAHCEVTRPIEEPYWTLHHLPVHPRENCQYYSTAWGQAYEVSSESAADTITAGVLNTLDFPRVIERAYEDGARIFIEIGPGNSCTRMIASILGERPHLARAICHPRRDNRISLVRTLAAMFVDGVEINWNVLAAKIIPPKLNRTKKMLSLPGEFKKPKAFPTATQVHPAKQNFSTPKSEVSVAQPRPASPRLEHPAHVPLPSFQETTNYVGRQIQVLQESVRAHDHFLKISNATFQNMTRLLEFQTSLLGSGSFQLSEQTFYDASSLSETLSDKVPRSLNFAQCTEFAVGRIGNVLGSRYSEIDSYPTRVRLPEGPLMLVDRILEIEGEPLSLTNGRVVTEHDVYEGRWYLDSNRIPTCVAVEAGQADLFLSGFLGIDFKTKGLAVYRLLDAVVTFHRALPGIGETIHYDIAIDRFFRQGETYLFRFRFVGSVNGEILLTMTEGCAGFFTIAELEAGKGIIHTELDRRPQTGKIPAQPYIFVPLTTGSLPADKIDSLRRGQLAEAFGSPFDKANLRRPSALPGGQLKLVDRIISIEPTGGRFGLGCIRGEMDIHPDDWFITCHFVDDQVMPGTLMYECCLHTLRVLLMRMGWVGEEGEVVCEPVPGVASRLKCRGQVLASTKVVLYEVTLKEVGYRPEPYVLCDALMYADGKPIVEITNMSLRMSGSSYEKLVAIWNSGSDRSSPKIALFDADSITAFAIGKPSEAFGKPYEVFDSERIIARLPGPPYQFLDRITEIQNCEPWKLKAGGIIEAEYDVPRDAWYFLENRCDRMPFSVLLEVALQPCGWLAAYLGSALTSPIDLSFRNLGGSGIQHAEIHPDTGTLTTRVKISKVSQSAGMIIQNYEYQMTASGTLIYSGDTYFGFFTKEALKNQLGMPAAGWYRPKGSEVSEWQGRLPLDPPYPGSMLRMIDEICFFSGKDGPYGLGFVEGRIAVDPEFWFFKAHFHQDPVWPGSLGLEAFLQLLKFFAAKILGEPRTKSWQAMALHQKHQWTYRGQVLPEHGTVTVQVHPRKVDSENRLIWADGYLMIDGRIIYEMKDFSVQE
ncbi:hypothetical protein KIH39_05455 [Telmatocola sphagniphila]|uniref:Ketosynthase family 3 (KS3) domain-containing protein n=1 Tax=Telmatocola sphagniphila TaxID=1123043 RepID=A0A8E6B754_9BACT|nr:polyketide synthase [Telmatocola sphagniphila]QVL33360.1 hypothetical protein KIH39_05455 [Telmatocola sphagniphila]